MREDTEDLENNQQVIGMKHLFRGFSIKAWNGVDFSNNKCTAHNRIVHQHCMSYYCEFWKDRNEKLYDKDTQRKRIIE